MIGPSTTDETIDLVLVEDAESDVAAARRTIGQLYPSVRLEHFASAEALLEALDERSITEWRPRLFVTDVNLAGLSGIELAQRLKRSAWRGVPLVIMSGSANEREVERCYEISVAGYFVKPLGLDELRRTWSVIGEYWLNLAEWPTTIGEAGGPVDRAAAAPQEEEDG